MLRRLSKVLIHDLRDFEVRQPPRVTCVDFIRYDVAFAT